MKNQIFTLSAAALLSFLSLVSAAPLAKEQMEEIFVQYDVPDDDAPDCQPELIDKEICPQGDEKLPCGPIEGIENHCKALLGEVVVKKYDGVEVDQGKNAFAGCVKYVGFHVFDLDHMACCDSDFCEDWIGEQFEKMADFEGGEGGEGENYYDDDDDDEYYDEDEHPHPEF